MTNQSGISKGLTSEEDVRAVNEFVVQSLSQEGVIIRETFTCPHDTADECLCKKPLPFFANKAAIKYGLNLRLSWAIGDHPHDIYFAENFGGRGLYVLTGHGERHRNEVPAKSLLFPSCIEAINYILRDGGELCP